jgi:hypothetical protein
MHLRSRSRLALTFLLALLLTPLTTLAADPTAKGPSRQHDATTSLWFPFAGIARYTPPHACRAQGAIEENVAFPVDPDHLLHVVTMVDFHATHVQVSVDMKLSGLTGIGLTSGMMYKAQSVYKQNVPVDPALGGEYPTNPIFAFYPSEPTDPPCKAFLVGHGGFVFFPDGHLNPNLDDGSFFFIGTPGGGT